MVRRPSLIGGPLLAAAQRVLDEAGDEIGLDDTEIVPWIEARRIAYGDDDEFVATSNIKRRPLAPRRVVARTFADDTHPDTFVDQNCGLVDRSLFLKLARQNRFPNKKEGKRRIARWGDVQAALRPNTEEAPARTTLDELDQMRLRWGVVPRGGR